MSFAKEVWDKLSKINVNERTESKNGLTYLSWAWAWQTLMENYPESTWSCGEFRYEADQSVTVEVKVIVKDGEHQLKRKMWLPVLDYKNKAIQSPDSMAINTARMRCLAKCIASFGLGSYVYAGEDLPVSESGKKAEPRKSREELIDDFYESLKSAENIDDLKLRFSGAWNWAKGDEKLQKNFKTVYDIETEKLKEAA